MQQPIRVAFVIDDLSAAGTETQLLALLRTLDRDVVEPTLILLNGEGEESRALEPTTCPVIRLGVTKLASAKALGAARHLHKLWKQSKPDIVQIYFHDSAYFALPVAKLAGVKQVLRVRNNLGYNQTKKHQRLSRVIRPWVSGFLTNTEAGREAIVQLDGLSAERVHVIENGVDLERFAVPSQREPGFVTIGCVANLRTIKNIDGLMRVAKTILEKRPDVRFEVAGEGDQRPALESLHRELNLGDQFVLRGAISDIPGFLAKLDLAVLPSHSEGMSNAVLEAMAAGLPVLATDVGANAKLLQASGAGRVVPAGDMVQFEAALLELIDDPDTRAVMGQAAREHVEQLYSRNTMRQRFEQFYRTQVGRA